MTVTALVARGEEVSVTGTGYVPEGSLCRDNEEFTVEADSLLGQLIRCLADCNDASISRDEQENWQVQGDPTEGALLVLRKKAGLEDTPIQRIATLPFDSEYKYMAVLVQKGEERFLLIKGAPDRLLDMADMQKTEDGREPLDRAWWDEAILNQARQGRRVLGAAVMAVDPTATGITHEDLASGLVFLGVAAIIDPPREEAIEAVRSCQSAGIRVKMITGDHLETAKAISTQIGIGDGEHALSGKELDEMDPDHLARAVQKYDVFARTSPEHKLRLVEALQAGGSIAAMTGDGVNDAPALRKADVGIAMGIKGTEVTKEAAEIVLADDNFRTIAVAVEEGRRVYDNLRKTILFILPTNGAESFLIIAAILFGTMIPLTPVQILWVNMVTSVTVSLALAFEKAEPDIMRRAPRNPKAPLLGAYFMWRIFFVSVLIGGLTLIMNQMMLHRGYDPQTVRTVTLQTIVMCQVFHLFNSRSIRSAALCQEFFSNRAVFVVCGLMLVLQLGVTYLPFMNSIFGTVPIGAVYWLIPILLGLVVFLVVEGEKAVMRRLDKRAWMRANPGRPMEEMPPVCGL
jgi:calcium-translocating P-type ATPase